MKILIGCEESQEVCKAFRSLGHEAYSCDLLECSGGHPEWHLQMDVEEAIILMDWDFIGLHLPCTGLAVSGNAWYGVGRPKHRIRLDAVKWTERVWKLAKEHAPKVYFENPVGVLGRMSSEFPKPQYIQPYEFGHNASKKTGLWLHNLPKLTPTKYTGGRIVGIDGYDVVRWANQTDSGQNKLGPSPDRAKIRSKTYPGIAKAMADQWG